MKLRLHWCRRGYVAVCNQQVGGDTGRHFAATTHSGRHRVVFGVLDHFRLGSVISSRPSHVTLIQEN